MTAEERAKEYNAIPWTLNKTLVQKGIAAEFECDAITIEFMKTPMVKVCFDPYEEVRTTIDIVYNPVDKGINSTETDGDEFEVDEQVTYTDLYQVIELTSVYFVFFLNGDRIKVWKNNIKTAHISREEFFCDCEDEEGEEEILPS